MKKTYRYRIYIYIYIYIYIFHACTINKSAHMDNLFNDPCTFTFELIPLGKGMHSLMISLASNNPRCLICH